MIATLTFALALLAAVSADVRGDALSSHNQYRAKHGAPPMSWHSGAAAHAQKHCDYLARTGQFRHSSSNYGKKCNEFFQTFVTFCISGHLLRFGKQRPYFWCRSKQRNSKFTYSTNGFEVENSAQSELR